MAEQMGGLTGVVTQEKISISSLLNLGGSFSLSLSAEIFFKSTTVFPPVL